MTDHALLCDIRDELRAIHDELRAIRGLLKARSAPLPVVPYEQVAAMMGRFEGPTMGAAITVDASAAVDASAQAWLNSPVMGAAITVDAPTPSPLMAMLSAPLPGKAGPDSLYPDPTECPGALNDAVTQDTIMQTIGVVGWTATIRPSAAEMGAMKAAYCKAHGIPDPTLGEWDHFISLELGGAPRDPKNLWWQRYEDATHDVGAHCKDRVENALKRQIVSGQITLAEGQELIRTDWYRCYLSLSKLGMLPMLMTFDPSGDADEDDNA